MSLQLLKKPRVLICLGLLVLLLGGAVISAVFLPTQYVATTASNTERVSNFQTNSPSNKLVYAFEANVSFERIGLLFASDIAHYPSGTINILISNSEQPDTLCQQPLPDLVDMTYIYCDYQGVAGQKYQLTIADVDNQLPYGFYIASSDKNPETSFILNGEKKEAVIIMALLNRKPDYFVFWYYITAAALVICYLIITIDKEVYALKKS